MAFPQFARHGHGPPLRPVTAGSFDVSRHCAVPDDDKRGIAVAPDLEAQSLHLIGR
jgi:hypothetical protein